MSGEKAMASVKVRVPGTTANCGPGFDSIGIACSIYNELELIIDETPNLQIEVFGEGAGIIPCNESNVVYQAVNYLFKKANRNTTGIHIRMINHIPLARGLGSSAAAIVSGLVSANAVIGNPFSKEELLNMATYFEGHPDNVAPAIFGGITVSALHKEKVHCIPFIPPTALKMVLAIPAFHLSTGKARQALPSSIPFADAVFNISRTSLLVAALIKGDFSHLPCALEDKLHQPYREKLIPGMKDIFDAAKSSGSLGAVISGAGPCIMAFATANEDAIGTAMCAAFSKYKVDSKYQILDIDVDGAKIIP